MGDTTEFIVKAFGVGFLISILVFVSCLIGTAVGALIGWVIQMTFLGDWVNTGFAIIGLHTTGHLVEIGAMLGFLGGFFTRSGLNYKDYVKDDDE